MPRDISTDIQRGESVALTVNQQKISAYAGETLATVLLAQGITTFNRTLKGQARGPFCNMGTCFECQVQMAHQGSDTFSWVLACMIEAQPGMTILTGATLTTSPGKTTGFGTDTLRSQQTKNAGDHDY